MSTLHATPGCIYKLRDQGSHVVQTILTISFFKSSSELQTYRFTIPTHSTIAEDKVTANDILEHSAVVNYGTTGRQ